MAQARTTTSVIETIEMFEAFVRDFDYNQLRARPITVPGKEEKDHAASDQAIQQLFNIFCNNFNFSKIPEIKEYFQGLTIQPLTQKPLIMRLADALISFRNKIEETELVYFLKHKTEYSHEEKADFASLAQDANWVKCFYYIVGQYLEDHQYQYGKFLKTLKNLCEKTYIWIQKNDHDLAENYTMLQRKQYVLADSSLFQAGQGVEKPGIQKKLSF